MSNIYLIGMMGSGKTVTGKRLAAILGCGFVDLDQMIQDRCGRSINEIFEKQGEASFRKEEAVALKEVSAVSPFVIATGGGTVLFSENVARMKQTGTIVYLETSFEILWERVKGKADRPLLRQGDPKARLESIFAERRRVYEQVSDFRVLTDALKPEAVSRAILGRLEKKL